MVREGERLVSCMGGSYLFSFSRAVRESLKSRHKAGNVQLKHLDQNPIKPYASRHVVQCRRTLSLANAFSVVPDNKYRFQIQFSFPKPQTQPEPQGGWGTRWPWIGSLRQAVGMSLSFKANKGTLLCSVLSNQCKDSGWHPTNDMVCLESWVAGCHVSCFFFSNWTWHF